MSHHFEGFILLPGLDLDFFLTELNCLLVLGWLSLLVERDVVLVLRLEGEEALDKEMEVIDCEGAEVTEFDEATEVAGAAED